MWCACPDLLSTERGPLCSYAPSLQFSYFAVLAYKCLKQTCCIQSVVGITLELAGFTGNITQTLQNAGAVLTIVAWIWAASHPGWKFQISNVSQLYL